MVEVKETATMSWSSEQPKKVNNMIWTALSIAAQFIQISLWCLVGSSSILNEGVRVASKTSIRLTFHHGGKLKLLPQLPCFRTNQSNEQMAHRPELKQKLRHHKHFTIVIHNVISRSWSFFYIWLCSCMQCWARMLAAFVGCRVSWPLKKHQPIQRMDLAHIPHINGVTWPFSERSL